MKTSINILVLFEDWIFLLVPTPILPASLLSLTINIYLSFCFLRWRSLMLHLRWRGHDQFHFLRLKMLFLLSLSFSLFLSLFLSLSLSLSLSATGNNVANLVSQKVKSMPMYKKNVYQYLYLGNVFRMATDIALKSF